MKIKKEIKIGVYYSYDDDGEILFDIDSMREDFEREIEKLQAINRKNL